MALNHTMMELPNPWTLEAQQDYTRVNGDPTSVRAVRASGNHLLKFLRKAFTEPDGKSMVKWVEITGFESFCFPGFKYDQGGGQKGGWDLETPRMSHFNWREYLATFPSSELEEIMADKETTEIVGEAPAVNEAPADAPAQNDPALSLDELNMLMQIVDLAVQRGAFRGSEASQVGAVFDKLSAFLGAVAQAQQSDAEASEGDAPAEESAEAQEEE